MDAQGILDQLFSSGKQMLGKGQALAEDKLGVPEQGESREAMVSGLGKGAIAGGLLALLVGTKGGRKVSGKVIKYGSLAAVATMAYKTYQGWAAQNSPVEGAAITDLDAESAKERGLTLVRAMIAAANADGHIDQNEQRTIQAKLVEMNLDESTLASMQSEIAQPVTPEQLASGVDSRAAAAEVYLLSSLVVDEANPEERNYLDRLAAALGLPSDLSAKLEQQAFA